MLHKMRVHDRVCSPQYMQYRHLNLRSQFSSDTTADDTPNLWLQAVLVVMAALATERGVEAEAVMCLKLSLMFQCMCPFQL